MKFARGTVQAVNGLLEVLMTEEIAVDYVPAIASGSPEFARVTWTNAAPEIFAFECVELREYLVCVQKRQYSALLHDGSFIQITYDIDRSQELRGHRLVYWPAPFAALDLRDFPAEGVADVLESFYEEANGDAAKLRLRGPWRFDYDPRAAKDEHPETHLTLNHSGCRVPVTRPLDLRRFCRLIFRHLHRTHYEECDEWTESLPKVPEGGKLKQVDGQYLHVHWRDSY